MITENSAACKEAELDLDRFPSHNPDPSQARAEQHQRCRFRHARARGIVDRDMRDSPLSRPEAGPRDGLSPVPAP